MENLNEKTSIKNKIYLYRSKGVAVNHNHNTVASVYGSIWRKVHRENFPIYLDLQRTVYENESNNII